MALELTLKRSKKPVYPTKTTINLAEDDQRGNNTRSLVLFVVALIAIALFAKFAVIDVMGAANASLAKVATAQSQLSALEEANADYPELQERYAAFAVNSLSDEERALADRGAILELLQGTVANMAELQSVSVTGNTLMLQFANTSLEDVSRVVASLESSDLVANVSMSTAKTDRNDEVVSTITVTLKGEGQDVSEALAAMDEAVAAAGSSTGLGA
ncbi:MULTISPECIES: hypothetical protein [Gordonibacter]|uniref:Uncharacterized protein n=1 Tax=Gordonibacter faecis TaxID=3047475 RepID=A0ABT7DK68_9ACTN|nr:MULTISPECIES: hypothetical protein [unclassified Gordonibacter]MDJ1649918.1 hypothetical protein [Gordonibacter sp. KGMB12511]